MDSSSLCLFISFLLIYGCSGRELLLPPSQVQALLRIQNLLEYPPVLDGWNNRTDFCHTISVSCNHSNDSITELIIVGVERKHLSSVFSIDHLFDTLSVFTDLTNLSLVSLGIWGNLPILSTNLGSLRSLNLSSNMLYGNIPKEISELRMLEALDLTSNFLTGSVPRLTGLDTLRRLHLGSNRLGPRFPLVGTNLVYLNIARNKFMDVLPEYLSNMNDLQLLDVSRNDLFGFIPPFLFSLPSVNHLGLNGNSLTGDVPNPVGLLNCTKNLKFVNISDNKLVGGEHQPNCLTSISFIYSWNCLSWGNSSSQHPISYCETTTAITSAVTAATTTPPPPLSVEKNWKKIASLVLTVIGGIIGCAILVTLVLMLVFKNNLIRKIIVYDTTRSIPAATTTGIQISPEVTTMGGLGLIIPYRVFDMEELEESTNNFNRSNLLEETSHFQMYKGQIQDGSAVIIKRIRLKQKHSHQLDLLSKLQHRHLVSILGHCVVEGKKNHFGTTTTLYLVFENITNGGTLRAHLTEMLKWSERVNSVIGIARGLQFLHTVTTPGICGNDLKIDNIFLDQTLTTKIHNYNLPIDLRSKKEVFVDSVMTVINRKKKNGNNYWYMKDGEEYDIYQLGLILLQVLTGESVSSESKLEAMKDQMQRIVVAENAANLHEFTDFAIRDSCSNDSVNVVVEVALKCLSDDITKRPSLDDVVWNLKYSAQVQEDHEDSGFVDIDVF